MGALARYINDMETKPFKPCKCGRPYRLVRSMLNIQGRKQVRMFECEACGELTWDEQRGHNRQFVFFQAVLQGYVLKIVSANQKPSRFGDPNTVMCWRSQLAGHW